MRRMDYQAAGVLLALMAQAGCAKRAEPDAYGNVEATEVVVGAEASGRLVTYTAAQWANIVVARKTLAQEIRPTDTDPAHYPLLVTILEAQWQAGHPEVGGVTGKGRGNIRNGTL